MLFGIFLPGGAIPVGSIGHLLWLTLLGPAVGKLVKGPQRELQKIRRKSKESATAK